MRRRAGCVEGAEWLAPVGKGAVWMPEANVFRHLSMASFSVVDRKRYLLPGLHIVAVFRNIIVEYLERR